MYKGIPILEDFCCGMCWDYQDGKCIRSNKEKNPNDICEVMIDFQIACIKTNLEGSE